MVMVGWHWEYFTLISSNKLMRQVPQDPGYYFFFSSPGGADSHQRREFQIYFLFSFFSTFIGNVLHTQISSDFHSIFNLIIERAPKLWPFFQCLFMIFKNFLKKFLQNTSFAKSACKNDSVCKLGSTQIFINGSVSFVRNWFIMSLNWHNSISLY